MIAGAQPSGNSAFRPLWRMRLDNVGPKGGVALTQVWRFDTAGNVIRYHAQVIGEGDECRHIEDQINRVFGYGAVQGDQQEGLSGIVIPDADVDRADRAEMQSGQSLSPHNGHGDTE